MRQSRDIYSVRTGSVVYVSVWFHISVGSVSAFVVIGFASVRGIFLKSSIALRKLYTDAYNHRSVYDCIRRSWQGFLGRFLLANEIIPYDCHRKSHKSGSDTKSHFA